MNNFKKILSIIIICVFITSCEKKCTINGIEIGHLIISNAEAKGINYCELVEKSLQNDRHSIKQLSLLNFENSVGYEHGEIMVRLINILGEQKFINALDNVNKNEKNMIESYLDVGLEYGSPSLKNRDAKQVFPELYSFLNK